MLTINLDWNFTTGDRWLVKTQGTEKQGYNWNKKFKKQEAREDIVTKGMIERNIYEQYVVRKPRYWLPNFNHLL